ncbi:DUF1178 family protein [Sphingomonas bacterium]|uniref:DUF1178 family protein n=1 Tax=Sphingomonas bacterium TaxID=1895847 RepID=UPI0015760C8B|nr:DUF1178 family protein [Sphingomonas bacterium]
MIVFDLRCGAGHVFEAWFGGTADWERQQAAGQVACPICGDGAVEKAAMAPAVSAKGNRAPAPAAVKAMMKALAAEQAKMLKDSTWVGGQFAHRARAMHAGDEAHRVIHGQATLAEARALVDDGVPVAPLPLPVTPPERLN